MSLLGKMDRLVFATGIDRIIFLKGQPRTFRWIPLFVIAALVAGYVLMARTFDSSDRPPVTNSALIGFILFYGAFLAAGFVRVIGPRFSPTLARPLDERELMVKAQAYALSGAVLAGFAMIGCFYMAIAGLLGLWQPHLPLEWINLGFGLQVLNLVLPTWIASWSQPRPAADHED
jgi:hypothetical protein